VTVRADGLLTAVAPGTALVFAEAEGVIGRATIVVRARATASWRPAAPCRAAGSAPAEGAHSGADPSSPPACP
jgi:hypothetical protein